MTIDGNLDYALARVHARHGQHLDEAGWRLLEASRDLGHYLSAARSTALGPWVRTVDVGRDCHAMERTLRLLWRQYVAAVAAWHPAEWQSWIAWLACVPDLGLLAQLARPAPAPGWMMADPVYGPLATGTTADRAAALARTALAPLQPAMTGRCPVRAAWSAHWRALQPPHHAHTQRCLDLLRQALLEHERTLGYAASSEPLRQQLAGRLRQLMRIAAGTVLITVCHLALLALELERLRGGLARRWLFGANQVASA